MDSWIIRKDGVATAIFAASKIPLGFLGITSWNDRPRIWLLLFVQSLLDQGFELEASVMTGAGHFAKPPDRFGGPTVVGFPLGNGLGSQFPKSKSSEETVGGAFVQGGEDVSATAAAVVVDVDRHVLAAAIAVVVVISVLI